MSIEHPEFVSVAVPHGMHLPYDRITHIIDSPVDDLITTACHQSIASPQLYRISLKTYLENALGEHVCGACIRMYFRHCMNRNLYHQPIYPWAISDHARRLRFAIEIFNRFRGENAP